MLYFIYSYMCNCKQGTDTKLLIVLSSLIPKHVSLGNSCPLIKCYKNFK